ncbi:uncharacterized protein LOC131848924 [Achroia grisella]|uniref:uncharacterized protein LOC131848924 n=1 Tax=Achroia grisella TaxID=688607 RepID=UPI0027D23D3F|nr:uncharacterized protein LOC131848924 [Achroia grisella]
MTFSDVTVTRYHRKKGGGVMILVRNELCAALCDFTEHKPPSEMIVEEINTGQLTGTRYLKAFKLFKRNKNRKTPRNRISPALMRSPSYSGTVDARSEIDLQRFCACRISLPPLRLASDSYETTSYNNSFNSYGSRNESIDNYNDSNFDGTRSDSAYDSARSSPAAHVRAPVCYATVTYFNVNDSEDSSSIRTEFTLLDYEGETERDGDSDDERTQNIINENIELVSSL